MKLSFCSFYSGLAVAAVNGLFRAVWFTTYVGKGKHQNSFYKMVIKHNNGNYIIEE
jgi:hypothetical protein